MAGHIDSPPINPWAEANATRTQRKDTDMNILMVLTSHNILGETGKPTGIWLEEFAAPY